MRKRRRSPVQDASEKEQTLILLQNQIIQPSVSPFAAELVLTPKSDGSLRYAVDFRIINDHTEADCMPLVRADDLLDQLGVIDRNAVEAAKAAGYTEKPLVVVSTYDCASTFWSCLIREEDRKYTAFNTSLGLMEWVRMPFGLKNSMSTYNRAMQFILRPPLYPSGNIYSLRLVPPLGSAFAKRLTWTTHLLVGMCFAFTLLLLFATVSAPTLSAPTNEHFEFFTFVEIVCVDCAFENDVFDFNTLRNF